jgi:hypothetical protein
MPAGGFLFVTKKKQKVLGVSTHFTVECYLYGLALAFGSTPKPLVWFEMFYF